MYPHMPYWRVQRQIYAYPTIFFLAVTYLVQPLVCDIKVRGRIAVVLFVRMLAVLD